MLTPWLPCLIFFFLSVVDLWFLLNYFTNNFVYSSFKNTCILCMSLNMFVHIYMQISTLFELQIACVLYFYKKQANTAEIYIYIYLQYNNNTIYAYIHTHTYIHN